MTHAAPERSHQQRMDALRRANQIRTRRSEFKRELKHGKVAVRGFLLAPPEWLCSMKVIDLLMALPKCGQVKANRMLHTCRMSPSKTVGGLSERQRAELLTRLRG